MALMLTQVKANGIYPRVQPNAMQTGYGLKCD